MMKAFFVAMLVLSQTGGPTAAPAGDVDRAQRERWHKYYGEVAAQYEMHRGTEQTGALKLHEKPVITYFNPVGGRQTLGAMFVWTRDGRPEIVGAIWSKQLGEQRRIIHSFHSLSLEALQATRNGKVFWSPNQPGIEPILLPSCPEPASMGPQRLLQMRSIAKDFTASTVRDRAERQLRLLPQPIYRFEDGSAKHDGGLFLWLEDWDPELLILLETRSTPDGPKWHVGFARFTNLPVTARYKDSKVWSFEASAAEPPQGGPEHSYVSVHGVDVLPAQLDE